MLWSQVCGGIEPKINKKKYFYYEMVHQNNYLHSCKHLKTILLWTMSDGKRGHEISVTFKYIILFSLSRSHYSCNCVSEF